MGFVFFGGLLMAWEVKSISNIIFEQQASMHNLIPLLLTTIPWNVGLILPMAAVLGGLLGTQHLSESSEIVASQGLGCGMREFLKPWAFLSTILVMCSVINAHWISPWACRMERQLFNDLAQESVMTGGYMPKAGEEPKLLRGNVFSQNFDTEQKKSPSLSDQTIYLGMSKDDDRLHIMQIGTELVSHLVSDKYSYKIEKIKLESHDIFEHIRLSFRFEDVNGKATTKNPGLSERLTDMSYKVFEVSQPIQIKKQAFYQPTAMRHLNTDELLLAARSDEPGIKGVAGVELSRMFSNPLACCALLLLGISIGLTHPRFYKGGAFVKSIALILLYFIVVKVVEGWIENNTINWIYISILLPFFFLLNGCLLLYKKMCPQRHGQHRGVAYWFSFLLKFWRKVFVSRAKKIGGFIVPTSISAHFLKLYHSRFKNKLIGHWTSKRWWANFAGTLAIFMTFHIFMEFATLAQFIAKGDDRFLMFVKYWICNLPVTLPFILPVVFLMAWVLTFSDASVSREWTALRAGGISLIQWVRSSWKAWGIAILAMFVMEAYLSPKAFTSQDYYYRQIKSDASHAAKNSVTPATDEFSTTLFFSDTGIFWYSEGPVRWGFPLLSPADAPSVIFWKNGEPFAQQLNWNTNRWVQGLSAETLFPASSLRQYQKTDEIPTLDLFVWQSLAPNAIRGTLLWGRLFKWLVGPCLFFAALGFVFPSPRKGRGQALGYALILSLIFMWMQNLFEGASKAGQFPPFWGVFAPMFILIGFGLINLRNLRT
jgi:lipopolysaccharide export LptBFGC system permease protein LptF